MSGTDTETARREPDVFRWTALSAGVGILLGGLAGLVLGINLVRWRWAPTMSLWSIYVCGFNVLLACATAGVIGGHVLLPVGLAVDGARVASAAIRSRQAKKVQLRADPEVGQLSDPIIEGRGELSRTPERRR